VKFLKIFLYSEIHTSCAAKKRHLDRTSIRIFQATPHGLRALETMKQSTAVNPVLSAWVGMQPLNSNISFVLNPARPRLPAWLETTACLNGNKYNTVSALPIFVPFHIQIRGVDCWEGSDCW
jgi:hypothetical protein